MGAFAENHIVQLTIPEGVTTIESYAFFYNRIRELTIPNNVTFIGEGAFSSNRISSVIIGNSVTEIGDGAFFNNRLTRITIPGSVSTLGRRVFESRITRVVMAPPVDYINEDGEVIYTTSNNFDTYFSSTGMRPGTYSFSRSGWAYEN